MQIIIRRVTMLSRLHLHVPEGGEVFLGSKSVDSQQDLNSEGGKETPLSLLQVEPNDECIQQDEEVKSVVKEPEGIVHNNDPLTS